MTELFKSDKGSFEFRDHDDKWGVNVNPQSVDREFFLFVKEEQVPLTFDELKRLLSEIKTVLDIKD